MNYKEENWYNDIIDRLKDHEGMDQDDDFFDKCLEGFTMFALNQGEVCTCPSRALIQESIYDKFMERAVARTKAVKQDNPLKMETMIGAQEIGRAHV